MISASIYCSNKTVKTTITKAEFENETKDIWDKKVNEWLNQAEKAESEDKL